MNRNIRIRFKFIFSLFFWKLLIFTYLFKVLLLNYNLWLLMFYRLEACFYFVWSFVWCVFWFEWKSILSFMYSAIQLIWFLMICSVVSFVFLIFCRFPVRHFFSWIYLNKSIQNFADNFKLAFFEWVWFFDFEFWLILSENSFKTKDWKLELFFYLTCKLILQISYIVFGFWSINFSFVSESVSKLRMHGFFKFHICFNFSLLVFICSCSMECEFCGKIFPLKSLFFHLVSFDFKLYWIFSKHMYSSFLSFFDCFQFPKLSFLPHKSTCWILTLKLSAKFWIDLFR